MAINPLTMVTTGTRHMLEPNVTLGLAGDRYNSRDKYRRQYSDEQRLAAGVGAAFAPTVPLLALKTFVSKGMPIPGFTGGYLTAGRIAAAGAAIGVAGVGGRKLYELAKDDGNWAGAGTSLGLVGGTIGGVAAGRMIGLGKTAPLLTLGAMVAGGVAGHLGGKAVGAGPGHIGEQLVQAPRVDSSIADRAKSFGIGAANHFGEVGPLSTGVSFGYSWGLRDAVQKRYSNAERSGAMHGDLAAAALMGGSALAVLARLGKAEVVEGAQGVGKVLNLSSAGAAGMSDAASAAGRVLAGGAANSVASPVSRVVNALATRGGTAAAGAAAATIAGFTTWKSYENDAMNWGKPAALAVSGATLAATGAVAALAYRSPALAGVAAAPRAAGSALVGAALIGLLSSARLPLQQFMNDARDTHAANGGGGLKDTITKPVAAVSTGVGAAAGGYGAANFLSRVVPAGGIQLGKVNIPRWLAVGAGTVVTGGAGGAMGLGLSTAMPSDISKVGISAAAGAGVGVAAGLAMKGLGPKAGLIAGTALGLSASALVREDAPVAAPVAAGIAR